MLHHSLYNVLIICDFLPPPHLFECLNFTLKLTFQDTHSKEATIEKLHHRILWLFTLPESKTQVVFTNKGQQQHEACIYIISIL